MDCTLLSQRISWCWKHRAYRSVAPCTCSLLPFGVHGKYVAKYPSVIFHHTTYTNEVWDFMVCAKHAI